MFCTNFPNIQGPLLKSLRFFISQIQARGRCDPDHNDLQRDRNRKRI